MSNTNNNNGSGQPIKVEGQRNGMNNAPLTRVFDSAPVIPNPTNTANEQAIQAEGQRNNKVNIGISKQQTPFE